MRRSTSVLLNKDQASLGDALGSHAVGQPGSFALFPTYPNPFNSSTVIRFALPAPAEVELAVFNTVGQKVATLVRGVRDAGQYSLTWDGRDNRGNALASGVYLYRLRSDGGSVESRQLLLAR